MSKRAPRHPQLDILRERVRQLIAQQGYSSVEKFAHEHGIEQSVISKFLSGNHDVMLSTALRIFYALDFDLLEHASGQSRIAERGSSRNLSAKRLAARIVLSEVSSLTVLRTPEDTEPLVIRGKKGGMRNSSPGDANTRRG